MVLIIVRLKKRRERENWEKLNMKIAFSSQQKEAAILVAF